MKRPLYSVPMCLSSHSVVCQRQIESLPETKIISYPCLKYPTTISMMNGRGASAPTFSHSQNPRFPSFVATVPSMSTIIAFAREVIENIQNGVKQSRSVGQARSAVTMAIENGMFEL